jgi:hypothetical protein
MFGFLSRARSITKIAIDPPGPRPGRAGLAIVLIVRNEETHIAEWARFHLLAGAAHIYAYDDGCTDQTIARLLATGGDRVTVTPWHQKFRDARRGLELHNQVLAYAHATRNHGAGYRWMTYIDVDEFLVPRGHPDLNAALSHLDACRSISLPWHMFGRAGHKTPPDGGVIASYTSRNPDPMSNARGLRNFKMIVDPCHVTALKVHEIEVEGTCDTCNDRGHRFTLRARDSRAFYSADHIQLNHYYTRSDAELQAKIARGPNLTTPDADHLRRVMRKVAAIEADAIEDLAAATWWNARR